MALDGEPSNEEFPYVEQDKKTADENAVNWNLTTVNLPSGGRMEVNFEGDDYSHVQDKEVMQLFKVTGAGNDALTSSSNNLLDALYLKELYRNEQSHRYLYVKLSDDTNNDFSTANFKRSFWEII